jgi:YidC/Oxa1 family membrane protein insertase
MPIGAIWQTGLETPLINAMLLLSVFTFGSYGLAILLFTVISRALLFPLTLRTLHSAKAMQEIQPRMKEIQKKYSDPRRRSEETMKLYKEAGVNPLGCLGPQLIQFPVFIALYQVIRTTLATTPESVIKLSDRLYDFDLVQGAIPLSTSFLWLDLQDNGGYSLAFLVGASMWLQQRISTSRNTSTQTDQQKSMNQMMQWMLPVMFGWFVITVPSGLGIYWGFSTVIGVVLQWMFVGPGDFTWGSLIPAPVRGSLGIGAPTPESGGQRRDSSSNVSPESVESDGNPETEQENASSGNQRTDRRRRRRSRNRPTRPSSRSSRRRGNSRG